MSAAANNNGHDQNPDSKSGIKVSRYWYLVVVLIVGVASFAYWWRFYAFTDQGYMVAQPIQFSHKLHAGKHQIPCQYCHFNAQKPVMAITGAWA